MVARRHFSQHYTHQVAEFRSELPQHPSSRRSPQRPEAASVTRTNGSPTLTELDTANAPVSSSDSMHRQRCVLIGLCTHRLAGEGARLSTRSGLRQLRRLARRPNKRAGSSPIPIKTPTRNGTEARHGVFVGVSPLSSELESSKLQSPSSASDCQLSLSQWGKRRGSGGSWNSKSPNSGNSGSSRVVPLSSRSHSQSGSGSTPAPVARAGSGALPSDACAACRRLPRCRLSAPRQLPS